MKIDWKKTAPYLVALVTFIGFAVVYCSPMLDGKVLYAGDTLGGIAKKFHCTVKQLKQWNGLSNANIREGKKLKICK